MSTQYAPLVIVPAVFSFVATYWWLIVALVVLSYGIRIANGAIRFKREGERLALERERIALMREANAQRQREYEDRRARGQRD